MPDRPRVAFQGEMGAFSEEAVTAFFAGRATPVPMREVPDVGAAVRSGATDYGLLPIENTVAGTVVATLDLLGGTDLNVIGEVIRPIRHCLLGVPGSSVEAIERIISHPVALAQCGRFLAALPSVEAMAVYDTAGAARQVAQADDPRLAAIAARSAADRYGLVVLAGDVQDRPDNQTRFLVVSAAAATGTATPDAAAPAPHGCDAADGEAARKTLLIVETENRPGALLRVLAPFASAGVNLCHLQSRPAETPWTYRFFLEIEADVAEPHAAEAVEAASARSTSMRVVGCFPRAEARAGSGARGLLG